MLNQPTIEKLHSMKLHGMADAFRAQLETPDMSQLGFEERFALLVDQQWLWKENRALARRLQSARLKERGVIEDIDYQHPRGLDRKLMRTLAGSEWVRQNQNVLLIGPTETPRIKLTASGPGTSRKVGVSSNCGILPPNRGEQRGALRYRTCRGWHRHWVHSLSGGTCREGKAFVAPGRNVIAFLPVDPEPADVRHKDTRLTG